MRGVTVPCVSSNNCGSRTMSVVAGRRILSHFCKNHLKKLSTRTRVHGFSSEAKEKSLNLEDVKSGIPASEAGKISAAVLKKFNESLVVENLEPPKMLQTNEVSAWFNN